jgi:glycogen synthase
MKQKASIQKIVIHSHTFLPNVGGLENIMGGLAKSWKEKGIEINVHTVTPDNSNNDYGYPVIRRLSGSMLLKQVKESDIFFEANISLKTFWIGLIYRNKWYVTHQLIYENNWKGRLKNFITLFANNIAASKYIADNIKGKSAIIHNFYDKAFSLKPESDRSQQLVFLGRMVSDKGVDLLLSALKILRDRGIKYSLTLIGDGPERANIMKLIAEWDLKDQVIMKGILKGEELMLELNRHRVLVVPSRWDEPFGIVALEGMACGCRVVCSAGGGLPEAVGRFGITFRNNDDIALAGCIEKAVNSYEQYKDSFEEVYDYLKSKTLAAISDSYLHSFEKSID